MQVAIDAATLQCSSTSGLLHHPGTEEVKDSSLDVKGLVGDGDTPPLAALAAVAVRRRWACLSLETPARSQQRQMARQNYVVSRL
jgi:hypothetical protein